ncbi:hypothetical protein [Demequina salsinemoris]|uniref:hypothetical protein n=1 Tax=Demequina salsinemoris TaxID=577470 RepID=UPI0007825931|nr:hypothetical protein [Demequina salsinemoris]
MSDVDRTPVVGPGGCVLHIGMMKTATTSIQSVASDRRRALRRHGVRYPGVGLNHSDALSPILGTSGVRHNTDRQKVNWERLLKERARHPDERLFLSSELIAGCRVSAIDRLVEEFGPDLHVVITVRPLAQLLPSAWQQYVKQRNEHGFWVYMKRVLEERQSTFGKRVWPKYGMAKVVAPWVARLGAERVTVVMLDKERPDVVFRAFEELLGLPDGLLEPSPEGAMVNRGLSFEEAELVRMVNQRVKQAGITPKEYQALVRSALVDGLMESRVPGPDEHRVYLPLRRAPKVQRIAERHVARVEALGVNVIGDLAGYAHAPTPAEGSIYAVRMVPAALVDDAVACVRRGRLWIPRGWLRVSRRTPVADDRPPIPLKEAGDIVAAEVLKPGLRRWLAEADSIGRSARGARDAVMRVRHKVR